MTRNTTQNITYDASRKNVNWNGLTLTNAAVCQILKLIHKDSNMLGLKINIKKSGCAGFSYFLEKLTLLDKNCLMYERDGAKLFIPLHIMPFVDGTELDYIQEGLNYTFKFNNPKAQLLCGCGESFNI